MHIDTAIDPEVDVRIELLACTMSVEYFIEAHCRIFDPVARTYIPFQLWPAQRDVLAQIEQHKKLVILKPRQVGMTWLTLADALWTCLFRPVSDVLIFSRAAAQSNDTLARLREMYMRLPAALQSVSGGLAIDNVTRIKFGNGSTVTASAPYSADMYTLTHAIIDEADQIPPNDLEHLLGSIMPAVDRGGKLVMLSRVDKSTAGSPFKRVYREARANPHLATEGGWHPIFLPATAHPERDAAWYEEKKRESLATTGSLDTLYENYPMTDIEALATRSTDKRIPSAWLDEIYQPVPMQLTITSVPFLTQYPLVAPGEGFGNSEKPKGPRWVIGIDPAEGNPQSDDSVAVVFDAVSGCEVALMRGKVEPSMFAYYVAELCKHYRNALVVVERNNHGHTVLARLKDEVAYGAPLMLYVGSDDRVGFVTTEKSKIALWNTLADYIREKEVTFRSAIVREQVGDVSGETLNAPRGAHDDVAMAVALAVWGFKRVLSDWEVSVF